MPAKTIQLLLVEDNPREVHRIRQAVAAAGAGFSLLHVARLSEALGILCQGGIDAVLLDLTLPDARGTDAVVLAGAVAPQVPLLALVSVSDTAPALDAMELGAQDYLIKEYIDAALISPRIRMAVDGTRHPDAVHPRPRREDLAAASTVTPARPAEGRPVPAGVQRLQPGDTLGGFTIERLLGDGGMGSVYLADQLSLGRKVAIKFLAERFCHDREFVRRFEREAAVLANLSHPNIVTIFDKGIHHGRYYFAMEYVDGVSLREILARARFSSEQALKTLTILSEALEYAHVQGVIHRDIKPENVLFTRRGQLKVTDFGLARLVEEEVSKDSPITQTGTLLGTKDYMAPEARHPGKVVDHRSDIYSLGVILYEMLVGELPVGRFSHPSTRVEIDARVDQIVLKALEADPGQRYARASELGRDLVQLIRGKGHHGPEGVVPIRFDPQERDGAPRYPSRDAFAAVAVPP